MLRPAKRCALLVLLVCPAAVAAQDSRGTYEFVVLDSDGESADTIASGIVVLMEGAVPTNDLPGDLLEAVRQDSRWLIRFGEITPTACFGFETSRLRVRDHEFLGGITEAGLTTWVESSEGIQVRLYQSPDAWFVLHGIAENGMFSGRVEHRNHDGQRLDEWLRFVGTRRGPATSEACLAAIEMGRRLVRR
jgi:hypothetical protein